MKAKNPQMLQMIQQAQKNNGNPVDLFKQITNGRSEEQMNQFYKQVEQMGFSPEIINKLK